MSFSWIETIAFAMALDDPCFSFLSSGALVKMKSLIKFLTIALLATFVFSSVCHAQDEGKRKVKKQNAQLSMVDQFLKQLEPAELSQDLKSSIKEMMSKVQEDALAKRTEAGIKPEVMKKRAAARKEGSEAGKKGAELKKHVEAALGLSPEQLTVLDETEKAIAKVKQEVGKKLSTEQMAKLPEQFRKSLETPAPKAGGKKKKESDK